MLLLPLFAIVVIESSKDSEWCTMFCPTSQKAPHCLATYPGTQVYADSNPIRVCHGRPRHNSTYTRNSPAMEMHVELCLGLPRRILVQRMNIRNNALD